MRNKGSLKAGDVGKVGLNCCIFGVKIALTSFVAVLLPGKTKSRALV